MNCKHLTVDGVQAIFIDYVLPLGVASLYNADGGRLPILVLLRHPTTRANQAMLYVPKWFQCDRGNPIHLNQPAQTRSLDAAGWKWACFISGWNSDTHSGKALIRLINKYFEGYPNAG
jgi:hypothetical protein